MTMLQSRNFSVGVNYINLTDIAGTSNNTSEFKNPVITGNYKINMDLNDWRLQLDGESGISKSNIENDIELPILSQDEPALLDSPLLGLTKNRHPASIQ